MKRAFFNSYFFFLNNAGRSVVFTSLFYSLWLIISVVSSANFDIHSFSGRMIGVATMQNVDVEARVGLFYKCIFLFLASFLVFTLLAYFIFKKWPAILNSIELRIINYTSIAGIFFFLFKLLNVEMYETIEVVYFLQKLMLATLLIRLLVQKENKISLQHFSIILSLSFAFYFFIADANNLLGYVNNPDFYIITFIIAVLLLISLNIFLNRSAVINSSKQLTLLTYSLLPLILLPFLSVLKDEIFLICKSNKIILSSQLPIYLILFIIILIWTFLRYKVGKKKELRSQKEIVARNYFPLLIFSLTAYLSYNYYTEYYDEIFESGNVYLPIMEHQLFGTLSPVEKLNTHLLSDYFFSYMYAFFNGLNINEITLYDFILAPLSYTLYYFLVKYLTRNEFIALLCVLLFPFAEAILPEGFCFAVLGIFALIKLINQQQSLKNYLVYFSTLVFLLCWRIDLGYNCLLTMPVVLLYYHFFNEKNKIQWKILSKAVAIVGGSVIFLLGLFSLIRHTNLFSKAAYLFNYCVSAQSYGYHAVGDTTLTNVKIHYFIFPVLVILLLVFIAIKFKELNNTKSQRAAQVSFLFISLFYLINFNRGLIRHSLFEGMDAFVSSFAYIILSTSVFILFRKNSHFVKCLLFFSTAFFLINTYRVPEPKGMKSIFERLVVKIKNTKNSSLASINSRVNNAPEQKAERYSQFVDFIKKNTNADETFLDFSNRPMLYFFTKKVTPSYFYQTPLCIQNDFLQERYIEDLADYKTPYVLFQGLSDVGYDNIDGVPNSLRHYRMAEYFYNNYSPYVIVNNFCIWRNNKIKDVNKKDTIIRYTASADSSKLKAFIKIKPGKSYSVKFLFSHKEKCNLVLVGNGNGFSKQIKDVDETSSYAILDVKEGEYRLEILASENSLEHFFVVESDYIPDYFSERTLTYNFEKLPYVWGTYDKKLLEEKTLFETNVVSEKLISIPEKMDRTTGNTLIVSCKNNTGKTQKAFLLFGNSKEKNKTSVGFDVLPSDKEEKYAIRISSIYKWYSGKVNEISFQAPDGGLTVSKIQITKGN